MFVWAIILEDLSELCNGRHGSALRGESLQQGLAHVVTDQEAERV